MNSATESMIKSNRTAGSLFVKDQIDVGRLYLGSCERGIAPQWLSGTCGMRTDCGGERSWRDQLGEESVLN